VEEKTFKMYLYSLNKHARPFSNKSELLESVSRVKRGKRWFILALRHFFRFLEEKEYVDEIELIKLKRVIPVPKTGADPEYPQIEEVIRGYHLLEDEEVKLLYAILFYSGIRVIEGYHILKTFEPARLTRVSGKVYRYSINWERGTKRIFYAYLPHYFLTRLRKVDFPKYETVVKKLNLREKGVDITSKKLRKWHDNFLVECGVPERIADFIQGRARVTVGSRHYLEMLHHADKWYSQIVDRFPRLE